MFPAELMLFEWSGAGYPGGQAPDPGDGVQDAAARLPRRANHRAKLLQRQLERLVFSARLVGLILLLPCWADQQSQLLQCQVEHFKRVSSFCVPVELITRSDFWLKCQLWTCSDTHLNEVDKCEEARERTERSDLIGSLSEVKDVFYYLFDCGVHSKGLYFAGPIYYIDSIKLKKVLRKQLTCMNLYRSNSETCSSSFIDWIVSIMESNLLWI